LSKKKYQEIWFLQVTDKSSPFLHHLKTLTQDQIATHASMSHDLASDSYVLNWNAFVSNEHTEPFSHDLVKKLATIQTVLQPIHVLLFPQWIMDRFKEALDQYARGQWLSSISLCGDIVEFIVNDFWKAYSNQIPSNERKNASKGVKPNLLRLQELEIVDDEDYRRLFCVRDTRDRHVHNYLKLMFQGNYETTLRSDDVEVLKKLSEFFSIHNIIPKYESYLDFAFKRFAEQ